MPAIGLQVKLLEMSERALALLYAAYRQCYAPGWAGDMVLADVGGDEQRAAFIRQMMRSGHESPLEHVKFTFAIAGVSRALTHQLVRHRIASYSQQSQRYVDLTNFDYIVPPSISSDPNLLKEFDRCMSAIRDRYRELIAKFQTRGVVGAAAHEDARFVLPQATETKIVVTMNCRELLHFFSQRCCQRAQWEIRALAEAMLAICREKLPPVFERAGARCEGLGYCPEGKFGCGRYPLREEVLSPKGDGA
jgi:thymidylate synthase (FAD)